jgi:hypothetical protein
MRVKQSLSPTRSGPVQAQLPMQSTFQHTGTDHQPIARTYYHHHHAVQPGEPI